MSAAKLLVAGVVFLTLLEFRIPFHEYLHCLNKWAKNPDAVCTVDFASPTHTLPEHPSMRGWTHGTDGLVPDDHAVIYPVEAAAYVALAYLLWMWAA